MDIYPFSRGKIPSHQQTPIQGSSPHIYIPALELHDVPLRDNGQRTGERNFLSRVIAHGVTRDKCAQDTPCCSAPCGRVWGAIPGAPAAIRGSRSSQKGNFYITARP